MPRRSSQNNQENINEQAVNPAQETAAQAADHAQETGNAQPVNETQAVNGTAANTEQMPVFTAEISTLRPESGVLALADVKVGELMTIRNVKIREDDYGLVVTMPRTRLPYSEQYKDSIFFADKAVKEKFDQTVEKAYHDFLHLQNMTEENAEDMEQSGEMEDNQEEASGMSMGM